MDLSIVGKLEVFLRLLETVLWGIFPEVTQTFRHLWADDVSAVTEILEGFDPDHSCPLYCRYKQVQPHLLSAFKHLERERDDRGQEDADELEKAEDMGKHKLDPLPESSWSVKQPGVHSRDQGHCLPALLLGRLSAKQLIIEVHVKRDRGRSSDSEACFTTEIGLESIELGFGAASRTISISDEKAKHVVLLR